MNGILIPILIEFDERHYIVRNIIINNQCVITMNNLELEREQKRKPLYWVYKYEPELASATARAIADEETVRFRLIMSSNSDSEIGGAVSNLRSIDDCKTHTRGKAQP